MKKKGIAAFGDVLSNLGTGHLKNFEYKRQPFPKWDVDDNECFLINNVNVIDVNLGKIRPERGVLIRNKRIEELILPQDTETIRAQYPLKNEVDGKDHYLIPGLSDLHGHLSLISEFDMSLGGLRYFDAQRQKNCEEALKAGCTFVRDSGGAFLPVSYLRNEIEHNRLLGPKIMASYQVMSPKGGMWDVGGMMNALAPMIFGGKLLNFVAGDKEIVEAMERLHQLGCDCFKTYFEDKPLYGGEESTIYTMLSPEQARLIRKTAGQYGKMVEAHSMFMKGSRRVIEAGFDTIAHLTCDEPYSLEDAKKMKQNGVAIVPTLSLGCYLAMNCGERGYPNHPEFKFFQEMLNQYVPEQIEKATIPELRKNYRHFHEWLNEEIENRKMPGVGQVYPERVHGFAVNAPESFKHFQQADTKVGVGTDGGTGITFTGHLEIEFEALHRYGYAVPEVLRMATLGNMEVVSKDDELGSIEKGKYADLVLLAKNPLEEIKAIQNVVMVFKDGRLVHERP
jgi:imidazolonepropionase-like amidohydrolase